MLIASKCIVPRSTPLLYSRNSFIRKALVDDVTCPLCGSLSHIFSNPETATDRSPAGAPATDKNSWGWNPLHIRLLMGSWPGTLLRWLLILFNWITNTQKADVLGRAFWLWEREGRREGGRKGWMFLCVLGRAGERKGLFPAIFSDHPYRKYYTLSNVICVICVHF